MQQVHDGKRCNLASLCSISQQDQWRLHIVHLMVTALLNDTSE